MLAMSLIGGYAPKMPWTIAANDPQRGSTGLLVEVHAEAHDLPAAFVATFCRRLFDRNVRVGLIVTPTETAVVRDTLSSMNFMENRYEITSLSTATLFDGARIGPPGTAERFLSQVQRWLQEVSISWHSILPENALASMVPDVVGHLAGAELEVVEDVPAAHAAE